MVRRTCSLLGLCLYVGCAAPEPVPIEDLEDRRVAGSEELIRALDTVGQAPRAALAMGRIQDRGYAPALARATRSDDSALRIAALFALGQLGLALGGEVPPEAVEACGAALEDPDDEIVAAAVEALGKLAAPGLAAAVAPLLGHAGEAVSVEAAHALMRARFVPVWRRAADDPPPLPADAVAALVTALDDRAPAVRRAAAHAFSRYGQPEAVAALVARLEDPDEWTRLFAVRGIGRSGDASTLPQLASGLEDESHGVRTETVAAMAVLGGSERIPPALASDPSFHVRAAMARALGDASGPNSLAILRSLETDPSPTVRGAAIRALARRIGIDYAPRLEAYVAAGDRNLIVAATGAAAELEAAGIDLLRAAAAHTDRRVRTAALTAIGQLQGVDDLILAALADPDLAVRGTAVTVLAGREIDGKLEALAEAYDASPGTDWIEIRESLADAVAEEPGAEAFLRTIATTDEAASVRRRAALALEARGVSVPTVVPSPIEPSRFLEAVLPVEPVVVLETSKGAIEMRCHAADAPVHVASFLDRVQTGFYDGLSWHRVVSNFVVQGGDPRGDGWGTGGYPLRDEINRRRFGRGAVGMPKAGKDTGGCQLFITHLPTPHLDGNYTVFGQVVSGLDVVDRLEVGDTIVRAYLRDSR